jgi:hypothetical protein
MKPLNLLIPLILTGCATTQPLQVTAPCPKPVIPAEPHYPAQDLKQGDSPATVAKSYVASLGLCLDTNAAIRHVCGGYE